MRIRYLGTAAAERTPAMFCNCEVCRRALEKGGFRSAVMEAGVKA